MSQKIGKMQLKVESITKGKKKSIKNQMYVKCST